MASRKEQKEAARQRRLAEEQAAAAKHSRTRRLQMLGGVIAAAIIVVVVLVVVSSGGSNANDTIKPGSHKATSAAKSIDSLVAGIPQSGAAIGKPSAKVTLTEYGDLQCPVCKEFSDGAEQQLIQHEVRDGTLRIVYRSYPTASTELSDWKTVFPMQQSAAYAAGGQSKAWNYILLFYREQQQEGTSYVNLSFLTDLARQIPGLDVKQWNVDRTNPKYEAQVVRDEKAATGLGIQGTPTLVFTGPKAQSKPIDGAISYSAAQKLIKQVS